MDIISINKFFGGQVRDDKSKNMGVASNIEELDIFGNKDFIQAEQIMSSDALPASSEIYAYSIRDNDVMYGYGKETAAGKVRLFSVASAGSDNPGAWATLFTSADATNLASVLSPLQYHETSEGNSDYLYYIAGTGSTWKLKRYDITGDSESAGNTLSGLTGSFDRPTIKRFYGELYICHGQYIAKVDDDGVFTEKAFTLPNGMEAIDIIPVSDVAIILARPKNRLENKTIGYWWDLSETTQFDDRFHVPMGGAQWVVNWKEKIIILCAMNGKAKPFMLSGAFPGAVPMEMPDIEFLNVAAETSTQPISSPKMISQKDGILYFGLYKTDKTGIYAMGQLDIDKPIAFILSKRFDTSDYANHKPTALFIHGSNYFAAFDDNGTADASRCETNNSPNRSSNAVYESIWIDDGEPLKDKILQNAWFHTYPLVANTSLALSVASNYGSYSAVNQEDGGAFNEANALIGFYIPKAFSGKKVYKIKVAFTSSTTNSVKLVEIGLGISKAEKEATKST